MAALGWERYHTTLVDAMAERSKETLGSLGWDGPLAAISLTRVNVADFFKETVAVVTNPAIDRERENAQFSTRTVIGVRPAVGQPAQEGDLLVELETPLLTGGYAPLGDAETMRAAADQMGTMTIEDLLAVFGDRVALLSLSAALDETIEAAIERLQTEAVQAVSEGALCLLLDDTDVFDGQRLWLDPLLATAAVDRALRQHRGTPEAPNLRRRAGIVLRSGALRDLHDLTLCVSMGANALLPYALYATAVGLAPRRPKDPFTEHELRDRLVNTLKALNAGLEKVTSTIGCHELRGYGHSFSSIGLSKGVAAILGTPNYFGSEGRGLTWSGLLDDAIVRAAEFRGEERNRLQNPDRFYPKMWKKAEDVAQGVMGLEEYTEHLLALESKHPVAIRHILGFKESERPIDPTTVDLSVGDHSLPMLIGAMSFGSQGELSYRTYAEAAAELNILCVNGEGGELPDLLGRYPDNRGQQIASARFGVNIGFLNSCNLLEIKIGQGAKPGEGGHLPGYKVTEQVAAARHTTPGVALISPSNNHDLYSIEDLAQLIDELKTANTNARVSVKIPVVPGVGIIAVGVAKAGADIINITGYEGGTGAARAHALRHVGLPAEIGLWLAHRALIESGLRDSVELWCDGGMKSGRDVVKMMCLGANRVGFGTMAMVAVGCTICRGCHEGTCHVGITTHVKTRDEAEKKGFKAFRPFEERGSTVGIVNVFNMLAEDTRRCVAALGFTRAQDLVGRADLLTQNDMHDRIDLTYLLKRVPPVPRKQPQPGGRRLTRPRNTLSKQITAIVADYVARGDKEMTYDDEQVMAQDRALGTHLSGAIARREFENSDAIEAVHLSFSNSAIPGNGLAAFVDDPMTVLVEGGAQDGVAKCARGGFVAVLKGLNHNGNRLDGSVGKSFAYGAQGGFFIVQGNADTRACIRLSGADVVFGGEIREPLRDEDGGIGARANLKGYAFEYMTSGRALVLGDPGPWMCAGMSGGVVYQRVQPEMGLTLDALRARIARGAMVDIFPLDDTGVEDVSELLGRYIHTLEINNQAEATQHLYSLLRNPREHFVKIAPPIRVN
ncbi:MAG: glutamate synthase-related protein, partial [Chloroflexota bacterium]